jgi:hypothetical protein
MHCPHCGRNFDQPVKFCPDCGAQVTPAVQPLENAAPPENAQPDSAAPSGRPAAPVVPDKSQQAYIRADYDPTRDGRPVERGGATIPAAPVPLQGTTAYPAAAALPLSPTRPSSTGMIVFAIVNMLCCGLGVGFVLGVVALIFAIMASSEPTAAEASSKLKTAKILNFIGLGFIVLQVLITVVFIIGSLFFAEWVGGISGFGPYRFDGYRFQ